LPARRQELLLKILHCAAPDCDYVAVMDWQQIVSLMIVGLAASALAWARLRRRKFSFSRDTHCGCAASAPSSPQGSIVFHVRRGERPRVVIKMK